MAKLKKEFDDVFVDLKMNCTIGKFKDMSDAKRFFKKNKRVGGLSVGLLKQYLKELKNDDVISIYINRKGELTNLHCKGRCMAPMVFYDKIQKEIQDRYEFEGV